MQTDATKWGTSGHLSRISPRARAWVNMETLPQRAPPQPEKLETRP